MEASEFVKDWKFDNIYPNPGSQTVHLAVTSPEKARLLVELVNVNGQVVKRGNELIGVGKSQIRIPVANLIGGNYMVRILNEKGEVVHTQSFVKQ